MRNVTKDRNKCDGVVLPWWVWLAGPVFLPDDLSSSSLSSHTDTPNDPSCDLWVWPPLSSSLVAGSDGCQGTVDRYVISEQMEETKCFLHGFFRLFLFLPRLRGVVGSHGDGRNSAPLSLLISLNKGQEFIQWPRVSLTAVVLGIVCKNWKYLFDTNFF